MRARAFMRVRARVYAQFPLSVANPDAKRGCARGVRGDGGTSPLIEIKLKSSPVPYLIGTGLGDTTERKCL